MGLFEEFDSMQIYAIGIVRSNQIRLPSTLKNIGTFKNVPHGTLEWKMHKTCKITCISWKKKESHLTSFHTFNSHWLSLHANAYGT